MMSYWSGTDCWSRWCSGRSSKCMKLSCSVSRDTGITLDGGMAVLTSPGRQWLGPFRPQHGPFPCIFWTTAEVWRSSHIFPFSPSKVRHGDICLVARRGHMAPKPEPARLAYVFGMVLAVAAIILAITTPNLATPSWSPIFGPQLPLLY